MKWAQSSGVKIPRPRRIKFKNPDDGCYHVVSRALQKEFRFNEPEKQQLLGLLKWLSRVYFVRIATFTILDNQMHLVLKMIKPADISLSELERRLSLYYEKGPPWGTEKAFEEADYGDLYAHFSDISMFMWDLKLRFARWYNKVHQGYGHVWAERFTSVLLVGAYTLRACMTYVELNAVRAGIVSRPEDYLFSGLGLFTRGGRKAAWLDRDLLKEAICCEHLSFEPQSHSPELVKEYRTLLYREGLNQPESVIRSLDETEDADIALSDEKMEASVFLKRMPAMTKEVYLTDEIVCRFLCPIYSPPTSSVTQSRVNQILTLPDNIPLAQLPSSFSMQLTSCPSVNGDKKVSGELEDSC